jgi:hypothetical protein
MEQKQLIVLVAVVVVIVAVAAILFLGVKPAPIDTTPTASEQTPETTPETTTPETTPETSLAAQITAGASAYCSGLMDGTSMEMWMELPKWRLEGSFQGTEAIMISDGSSTYMYMLDQWFLVDGALAESISIDSSMESVQETLDNPDVECQLLNDADVQFELPSGVTPTSLNDFLMGASAAA